MGSSFNSICVLSVALIVAVDVESNRQAPSKSGEWTQNQVYLNSQEHRGPSNVAGKWLLGVSRRRCSAKCDLFCCRNWNSKVTVLFRFICGFCWDQMCWDQNTFPLERLCVRETWLWFQFVVFQILIVSFHSSSASLVHLWTRYNNWTRRVQILLGAGCTLLFVGQFATGFRTFCPVLKQKNGKQQFAIHSSARNGARVAWQRRASLSATEVEIASVVTKLSSALHATSRWAAPARCWRIVRHRGIIQPFCRKMELFGSQRRKPKVQMQQKCPEKIASSHQSFCSEATLQYSPPISKSFL